MRRRTLWYQQVLILMMVVGMGSTCNSESKTETPNATPTSFTKIERDNYQLYRPIGKIAAVLVLFGGYPETAADIQREFPILESALQRGVAVVFSKVNQILWLETAERRALAVPLQTMFREHQLPRERVVIGGFSSGGNLSLLLSNYLHGSVEFNLKPVGVFAVDAPVDLVALYAAAERRLRQSQSEIALRESRFIVDLLGTTLGNPADHPKVYERQSVYVEGSSALPNVEHLQQTDIRLYTEPDSLWWSEHRNVSYDQTNAFHLESFSRRLRAEDFERVTFIATQKRGYRANGDRHPHSWSIVDEEELVEWILGLR